MRVYLSSPGNQAHARCVEGMPVLLSFATFTNWERRYVHTYSAHMLDSGAYSVFASGQTVDLDEFAEWASGFPQADACAALDDIAGDWRLGLENWDRYPWQFPTYHETDPPEALDAILERLQDPDRARMRRASPQWLGLGMVPPRTNRAWLLETLERLPPSLHVHGFAMRRYVPEIAGAQGAECSFDSVNWILDARKVQNAYPWLSPVECVEIIVKRYRRERHPDYQPTKQTNQIPLF